MAHAHFSNVFILYYVKLKKKVSMRWQICINQQRILKPRFSIFPLFSIDRYIKQPTNCSLLGTDKIRGQISEYIFEIRMIEDGTQNRSLRNTT